jgi:hypothetical protein
LGSNFLREKSPRWTPATLALVLAAAFILVLLALLSVGGAAEAQTVEELEGRHTELYEGYVDLIERQVWVEANVSYSEGRTDMVNDLHDRQEATLEEIGHVNEQIRAQREAALPEMSDEDMRSIYDALRERKAGLEAELEQVEQNFSYSYGQRTEREDLLKAEIGAAEDQMRDLEKEAVGRDQDNNNERVAQETKDLFSGGPISKVFFGVLGAFVLVFAVFEVFAIAGPLLGAMGLTGSGRAMANTIAFPGRALGWTVRKGAVYGYRSIQGRRTAKRAITTEGLHTADPDAPGVTVRTVEDPARTISSTEGIWHVVGKDYFVPHLSAYASTGIGKNEHLLNPAAWNIIAHRPESVVVNDVKGDMVEEFLDHAPEGVSQWVFSFMEDHAFIEEREAYSAINLIETPKMAATTAAAIYPVEGVKVPIFNQGARDLFEALARALGYSESNLVELYRTLKDRSRLEELAERDDGVRAAIGGANEKFAGDIITSARLPLSALEREEVARVFAPDPDSKQPDFCSKQIVYVCIPQDSQSIALLAGAIHDNLANRATASRRGTYFLLDEAGSCITLENLAKYLGIGRGLGAYFFLVFQDMAQLEDRIGRARAHSALGNARVQFFGQTGELATAEYLSKLSGTVRVGRRHYRDEPSLFRRIAEMFGAAPFEYREEERPRVKPEHLVECPAGVFYVHARDEGTEMVVTPPWHTWRDRVLGEPTEPIIEAVPSYLFECDDLEHEGYEDHAAKEPPTRDNLRDVPHGETVRCPSGCEKPPAEGARFCPECGGRL